MLCCVHFIILSAFYSFSLFLYPPTPSLLPSASLIHSQTRKALPVVRTGTLYLDTAPEVVYYIQSVLHHELFHMFDDKILSMLKGTPVSQPELPPYQEQHQQQHQSAASNSAAAVASEYKSASPLPSSTSSERGSRAPDPLFRFAQRLCFAHVEGDHVAQGLRVPDDVAHYVDTYASRASSTSSSSSRRQRSERKSSLITMNNSTSASRHADDDHDGGWGALVPRVFPHDPRAVVEAFPPHELQLKLSSKACSDNPLLVIAASPASVAASGFSSPGAAVVAAGARAGLTVQLGYMEAVGSDPLWLLLNEPGFVYGPGGAKSRQSTLTVSLSAFHATGVAADKTRGASSHASSLQHGNRASASSPSSPSPSPGAPAAGDAAAAAAANGGGECEVILGFTNGYSMSAIEEDKAEVYAGLMRHPPALLRYDVGYHLAAC